MNQEMWFRVAFVAAFVILASTGAAAARRASKRHGAPVNQLQNEVKGLIAIRGALGIVFYASLILWLFWPRLLPWMYLPLANQLRWIAIVLFIPALAFMAWSFRAMGNNYRGGVGLYDEHELVTTGPYKFMRHPIYAGFIVMMWLVMLVSSSWVLGVSGLLLVSLIPAFRIPTEEAELRERFGKEWDEYARAVPMFLPGIR